MVANTIPYSIIFPVPVETERTLSLQPVNASSCVWMVSGEHSDQGFKCLNVIGDGQHSIRITWPHCARTLHQRATLEDLPITIAVLILGYLPAIVIRTWSGPFRFPDVIDRDKTSPVRCLEPIWPCALDNPSLPEFLHLTLVIGKRYGSKFADVVSMRKEA